MRVKTVADIGRRVREVRKQHGWSQEDLARRCGVSRVWLGNLERGKPSVEADLVLRTLGVLGLAMDLRLLPPDPFGELDSPGPPSETPESP
jgi:HTH-type transcriptional regulator/antitoxin HipB